MAKVMFGLLLVFLKYEKFRKRQYIILKRFVLYTYIDLFSIMCRESHCITTAIIWIFFMLKRLQGNVFPTRLSNSIRSHILKIFRTPSIGNIGVRSNGGGMEGEITSLPISYCRSRKDPSKLPERSCSPPRDSRHTVIYYMIVCNCVHR